MIWPDYFPALSTQPAHTLIRRQQSTSWAVRLGTDSLSSFTDGIVSKGTGHCLLILVYRCMRRVGVPDPFSLSAPLSSCLCHESARGKPKERAISVYGGQPRMTASIHHQQGTRWQKTNRRNRLLASFANRSSSPTHRRLPLPYVHPHRGKRENGQSH